MPKQMVLDGMPEPTKAKKGKVKEYFAPVKAEYPTELLARALAAERIAIDTETDTEWKGIGPEDKFGTTYCADVTTIALVWQEGETLESLVMSTPFTPEELAAINQIMTGDQIVIGHNLVFDMRQLSRLTEGRTPEYTWDTMVMARLLHPGKQIRFGNSFSMLNVAKALGIELPKAMIDMKENRDELHNIDPRLVQEYCRDDTLTTYRIYEAQRDMVNADWVKNLVEWEMRAVRTYCQMSAKGVRLNTGYIKQRIVDLGKSISEIHMRLVEDGLDDDAKRSQQLKYIYETKGVPLPEWEPGSPLFTKGGHKRLASMETPVVELSDLSLDKRAMAELFDETQPYASKIKDLVDYSQAKYIQQTLLALLDHAAIDGRAHSIVTIKTATGRRASESPQVQNWKMAESNVIAGDLSGAAIGDEGCTLVEIDYSNAENWIAAMLSGDNNLAAACAAEDFHSAMAASYWPDLWAELMAAGDKASLKALRRMSKTITFGTAYGMGSAKLARGISQTVDEAKAILKAKDAAFPMMARSKRDKVDQAKKTGFTTLWTGRRVVIPRPEDYDDPENRRNQSYVAWNYQCQGGVGEMVKRSIVLISEEFTERGYRSRVALDQHDAMVISVAHEEWEEALNIATTIMENVMPVEFNRRTTPNIQWTARPNLDENSHKWGKGQPHPGDPDFKQSVREAKYWREEEMQTITPEDYDDPDFGGNVVLAETVEPTVILTEPRNFEAAKKVVEATSSPKGQAFILKAADFTYPVKFRTDVPISSLTDIEISDSWELYTALIDHIGGLLSEPHSVRIPLIQAERYTGMSNEVEVTFENWVKVAAAWLAAAETCNIVDVLGVTKPQLLTEYERRRDRLAELINLKQVARDTRATIEAAMIDRNLNLERVIA